MLGNSDRNEMYRIEVNNKTFELIFSIFQMSFFFAIFILFCKSDDDPPAPRYPLPTNETLIYQRQPLAAFIHFSLNTFTESEEINGSTDPNVFKPTNLDTEQWATVIKEAGFNRIIFPAKHNDGFCLWKTNTTNYSISNSKDFQSQTSTSGDILFDLQKSCRKHGLELGLSISLWDKHSNLYGTDQYNDLLYDQLTELLTNYGPIYEIHFDIHRDDSEKRKSQKYDFPRFIELIHQTQPHCLISSPSNTTLRSVGRGFLKGDLGSFYSINSTQVEEYFQATHTVNSSYIAAGESVGDSYSAVEYVVSIQKEGYFWSKSNENKLRSILELEQIYFDVVGQSQILLLGISPNQEGLIPKNYAKLVRKFGESINKTFGRNYANQSMAVSATAIRNRNMALYDCRYLQWIKDPHLYWSMNDGMLYGYVWFDFCKTIIFDVVTVTEHLELGQRITKFTIDYEQNGFWRTFAEGLTIGELRAFRTKPISAQKLYIKIEDAEDVLALESFGIFKLDSESELGQFIPIRIFECDQQFEGSWTTDGESNFTSSGSVATSFTGSYMSIVAPVGPDYGKFDVILDEKKYATVDLHFDYHRDRREVFRIESLEQKQHNVTIRPSGKDKIGLYHIYYLDNYEIGLFEIASRNYDVLKGDSVDIEIKRIGGSKTNVSVTVKTDFFTAQQNKHFVPFNQIVNFDEGETSKIVTIETINYDGEEDLSFNVVIDDATLGSEVGFNQSAMVTIKNSLEPDDDDKGNDSDKVFIIVGIVIAAIIAIVMVVMVFLLCRKKKNDDQRPLLTTN